MNPISSWVYLHYPVCQHHCSYCDFNVVSRAKAPPDFEVLWLNGLARHFNAFCEGKSGELRSLYLGGGTPSLLSLPAIEECLKILESHYTFRADLEFTIECNPESLSKNYLEGLRGLGVNRVSLGVQTTLAPQLRRLERLATHRNILETCEWVSQLFKNFSFDFMIGIPDQNLETLKEDFKFIESSKTPHISIYLLTLDGDHKLKTHPSMKARLADVDLASEMYLAVCEFMRGLGYRHYEVSNFSKPGFESCHNQNYWDAESDYLGLGPGAHGYLKAEDGSRIRYECERDLLKWSAHPTGIAWTERLDEEQRRLEKNYLALRTRSPLSPSDLNSKKLQIFIREGLVEQTEAGVHLTDRGWLVMESIAAELIA